MHRVFDISIDGTHRARTTSTSSRPSATRPAACSSTSSPPTAWSTSPSPTSSRTRWSTASRWSRPARRPTSSASARRPSTSAQRWSTARSTQTVTLSNLGFDVGDPAITVTSVVAGGGEFSTDFSGPLSLRPAASTSFDVTFSPTSVGAQTGTSDDHPLRHELAGDRRPRRHRIEQHPGLVRRRSGLSGESSNNPTSLQFGPDGRLYVAQQDGTIKAYTVLRNGADRLRTSPPPRPST